MPQISVNPAMKTCCLPLFWVIFSFLNVLGFPTLLLSSFSEPNESYFSVGLTKACMVALCKSTAGAGRV